MGLGHRIGKLAVGYDADVVIWHRHPLSLGGRPQQVIIDGIEQFEDNASSAIPPSAELPKAPGQSMTVDENESGAACSLETSAFVLRNIGKLFMNADKVYDAKELKKDEEITIIVKNGEINCAGIHCSKRDWEGVVYNAHGGYVLPVSRTISSFL